MISLHWKSYFKVRLNVNVIIEINLEYLKIKAIVNILYKT
jgi:hypothetical protein